MRKVSYIVKRADGTRFKTDNYAVASDVRIKNRIVKTILTDVPEEISQELKDRYRARAKRIMAYYKRKAMENGEEKA
jgi:CRISPR/Cas system type I-B associated protein Csh2 (Cas7 group RAMP superfamily)